MLHLHLGDQGQAPADSIIVFRAEISPDSSFKSDISPDISPDNNSSTIIASPH
jgi:hypothetical protein